jgi:putative acyl-CoA dehydrogenase
MKNQPPPLRDYNLVAENRPLVEGLRREGAGWAEERMLELGAELGGAPLEWGRLANEHPPQLRTHDRFGDRIDEVAPGRARRSRGGIHGTRAG